MKRSVYLLGKDPERVVIGDIEANANDNGGEDDPKKDIHCMFLVGSCARRGRKTVCPGPRR